MERKNTTLSRKPGSAGKMWVRGRGVGCKGRWLVLHIIPALP